jgi:hypothetical protein
VELAAGSYYIVLSCYAVPQDFPMEGLRRGQDMKVVAHSEVSQAQRIQVCE